LKQMGKWKLGAGKKNELENWKHGKKKKKMETWWGKGGFFGWGMTEKKWGVCVENWKWENWKTLLWFLLVNGK